MIRIFCIAVITAASSCGNLLSGTIFSGAVSPQRLTLVLCSTLSGQVGCVTCVAVPIAVLLYYQVFDKWSDDSDSLAAAGSLPLQQVSRQEQLYVALRCMVLSSALQCSVHIAPSAMHCCALSLV